MEKLLCLSITEMVLNCRIVRKKEVKGRRLALDSKLPISTLSLLSRKKRFQNIRSLNKKFTETLPNKMFKDEKTCLNRKKTAENSILDFMARDGKVPKKCKHSFHAGLVNDVTECAKLQKLLVKKELSNVIEDFVTEILTKI